MSNKSSINQEEIQKFSAMSKDWWNKDGKFKVLHQFNHARIEFILRALKQSNINNGTILDIGCGGGLLTERFAKLGYTLTGIDAEENTIAEAKKHALASNLEINYMVSSAEQLLQTSNIQYDVVFAMEIIEHVDNLDEFINTITKLVKPGGLIFFSSINRNIKSLLLAKVAAEYILNWLPIGTHDYNKFVTPAELTKMLEKSSINVMSINGINFSIITQKWTLSNKPEVNYILYGKKI